MPFNMHLMIPVPTVLLIIFPNPASILFLSYFTYWGLSIVLISGIVNILNQAVRNVVTALEVVYINRALSFQNVLCYCPGYLKHVLAEMYCRWYMQNLGMLLGHLMLEKADVIALSK